MLISCLSRRALVVVVVALFLASPCRCFPDWNDGGDEEDYPPDDNFYQPPGVDDVRSPCPAINTLANHGFIKRSGKNVNILDIAKQCVQQFSFIGGGLFFIQLPIFNMEYEVSKDDGVTIDLDALFQHAAIEHDASLVREDFYFEGDSDFSEELFFECADTSEDDDTLTFWEIIKCSKERVLDSRRRNPDAFPTLYRPQQFISVVIEKPFMMLFGNQKDLWTTSKEDLYYFLGYNRFPDDYLPRHQRGWGYVGLLGPLMLAPIVVPFLLSLIVNLEGLLRPIEKDYLNLMNDHSSSPTVAQMSEVLVSMLDEVVLANPTMEIPDHFVEFENVLEAAAKLDNDDSAAERVIAEYLDSTIKKTVTETISKLPDEWAEVAQALMSDFNIEEITN